MKRKAAVMMQDLNLYWRWARRKARIQRFAQLSPWGLNTRNEASGDNFPGLDRALLISRLMEDQALKQPALR